MAYVDGFVLPVPKSNYAAYRKMATKAGKVWREHGALDYKECIADDVKKGKWTSFPRSVKLKPGETVFFSYIVYKSRADRDRINAAMQPLVAITPDAGAYVNEADYFEPDWQRAFWGENYPRLLAIKHKYDPDNLFTCHHCVGSEGVVP